MADNDVEIGFGAQTDGAIGSLNQLRFAIEGLTDPLRAVRSTLGDVGEAFVAAFAVEEIIKFTEEMGNLGLETLKLSEQLGLSTEQVSEFQSAADSVGVSGQSAAMALERMERGLAATSKAGSPAQQSMHAMGIEFKDATGAILPLNVLLPQIADKFASYADGPNKTALAMELFGRAGAQLIPVLDKGSAGLQELYDKAEAAGVVLSEDTTAGMVAVHDALFNLSEELKGDSIAAFNAIQPVIVSTVTALDTFLVKVKENITSDEAWAVVWSPLITALNSLWTSLTSLIPPIQDSTDKINDARQGASGWTAALEVLVAVFKAVVIGVEAFVGALEVMVEAMHELDVIIHIVVEGIAKAFNDFIHGDMASLASDWDKVWQKYEDVAKLHAGNIKDIFAGMLANMKQGLKDQNQEQSAGADTSLGQRQPQEIKPAAPNPSALNANNAAVKEAAQLFLEEEAEKRASISETESLQATLDALSLANQKSQLKKEVDKGILKQQQYYTKLGQLEQQETAQTLTALNKKLADLQAEYNEEQASTKLNADQKIKIEEQYVLEVQKLQDQITITTQKGLNEQVANTTAAVNAQVAQWKKVDTQIVTGIGGALQNMLTTTQSWQQQMVNALNKLVEFFFKMAEEMVVKWLVSEQAQTAATVTGNAARTASDSAAAGSKSSGSATSSIDAIIGDAAKAYAGVFAWAAPTLGPFAAIPAGAAFVAVMAMEALVPSAAGGMVVENDTLAAIHKDEMVLPAALSQGIQGMIGGGNGGTSGGQSGGDTYVINVSAIDGQSAARYLMQQGGAIVASLAAQKRNLNPFFSSGPA